MFPFLQKLLFFPELVINAFLPLAQFSVYLFLFFCFTIFIYCHNSLSSLFFFPTKSLHLLDILSVSSILFIRRLHFQSPLSPTATVMVKGQPFYQAQNLQVRISGRAHQRWMAHLCFTMPETSSWMAQVAGDGWDAQLGPHVWGLSSGLVPRFLLSHLLRLKCPEWFLHVCGVDWMSGTSGIWLVSVSPCGWPQDGSLRIVGLHTCWLFSLE